MTKTIKKKTKKQVSAQKTRKITPSQTKAAEYVGYLLELHKLQGLLLAQLYKEIQ